jgi:hypothetical protein
MADEASVTKAMAALDALAEQYAQRVNWHAELDQIAIAINAAGGIAIEGAIDGRP